MIRFQTNHFTAALQRIDIFLALTTGNTNGYALRDFDGTPIHYTAKELAKLRAEFETARQLILKNQENQNPAKPHPQKCP